MRVLRVLAVLLSAAIALAAPRPAAAIDVGERVQVHGYGNWSYGRTDGNSYMGGSEEGNYDNLEFSLSVTAQPADRFSVHAQAFWEIEEKSFESSMDFAFAEYSFSPALGVRLGRVKQPFGIYTEIFDVGTVYPFVSLAQGIYGDAGFVAEHFLGLGFTGRILLGSGWSVQYDLYGGEMESAYTTPWAGEEGEEEAATDIQDMVGGRLVFTTPSLGTSCGISAYTGSEDTETFGEESENHRHTAYGAHVETFQGPLTLRAEYAHQDIGLAVNYFFSPNMVLKFAYHMVDGNRFTSVDDEDEEQDEETNLYTAGVSFSF